jgi:putative nucleotidyltransferase with HDIG domain
MNHILCHPILENRLEALGNIELPILPDIYIRLIEEIKSENANLNSVSSILEVDASLSADILKAINSAAYGLRTAVIALTQAISLLGFGEVSNIVLAVKVLEQFPSRKADKVLELKSFWEHSLASACAARVVARYSVGISKENKDDSFIAGLLHDMGKLVEMKYFPDDFKRAVLLCQKELLTIEMAEKKIFEFSHQDVGAFLADKWNMSRNLIKSFEMHNTPWDLDEEDDGFQLVSIIHIADIIARFLELGSGGDPFIPAFHPDCFTFLDLDVKDVDHILRETKQAYDELSPMLNRIPS